MAALSIRELFEKYIEPLSADERRRLVALMEREEGGEDTRDITELKGLGASIWDDSDTDDYLDDLRDEWEHRP